MAVEILDNTNRLLVEDLRRQLKQGAKLQIAAASFSIYAFEALSKELQNIDELQFLFTTSAFTQDKSEKQKREFYIPKLNHERDLYGTEFEICLRNRLSQRAIARECAEWVRAKVHFKANISDGTIPTGFFNVMQEQQTLTYMPFNEFTTTEIGTQKGKQLFSQVARLDAEATRGFVDNFNNLWKDQDKVQDVTDQVLEGIETVYRENSPEFMYFLTLYHIFHEFLSNLSDDDLPNETIGFRNSQIWNKLYNFQRDAALAIINKLERYNGCILADSVGLGKTFTALAVIKYYESRNKSVLVLCPKKLQNNWQVYRANYKNNSIAEDRLRYDVLFHSDLSRDSGESNGIDLAYINWGNYDLVVIDESHNLRNGGNIDENDENPRGNRYTRLMNKVIREGIKTKVLMLTATPVNNRFNDLKNQLQLAYEGHPELINPLLGTKKSIDKIFKDAQRKYNEWTKANKSKHTTEDLLSRLDPDFFKLLDALTIARSRKHIEKCYNTTKIGSFPKRSKPISRHPPLTDISGITFPDIAERLNQLNLSVYAPSHYIHPSKSDKYNNDKGLSMSGREEGIRQLMAVNLLKRLESSVEAFRRTLERIKSNIDSTIKTIDNFQRNQATTNIKQQNLLEDLDVDDIEDDAIIGGKKTPISLADMDYLGWRRDLEADQQILAELLKKMKMITPAHDRKLQQLIEDLQAKFRNPINGTNKKVIIFTAFSDTADYLYEQLAQPILNREQLYTALVTGNAVKTNLPKAIESSPKKAPQKGVSKESINDFNKLLTLFSPVSKDRNTLYPEETREIDVLIATDCISEGQNLQDCDYLINYDIHWNPVRIIQRFGRIDRIGSKNQQIQLVNYWPDMALDQYINLERRVEDRMRGTVVASTGDDNLLSDEEQDLNYRKDQLQRLQNEVIDIDDTNTGINIMDLGLNDFRLDLLQYIHDAKHKEELERAPLGMHAVVKSDDPDKQGVIFVLRNRNNAVNIGNLLHPFYMVHIRKNKEIITDYLHPKQLLDFMRHVCKGKSAYDSALTTAFNCETKNGCDMKQYSDFLGKSVENIIGVKQQSDIESLFSPGETTALVGDIHGLDDFELISFLVVK